MPTPTIRKQTALVIAVVALLAGVFIGWQGATLSLDANAPTSAMPQGSTMQSNGADTPTAQLMAQAKVMEEKAAKTPNDAAIWAQLGNTYFDAGFADRAITAYKKSLAINAGQPDVLTDMGIMLRQERKFQEALDAFRQAATLDPKHEQSRLNMGVVLLHDLNDKAGAIKAWQELLAINPNAQMPEGQSLALEVRTLQAK